MKQNKTKKTRSADFSAGFEKLDTKDQQYLETLTAQLAEIHTNAPETRRPAKKKKPGHEK